MPKEKPHYGRIDQWRKVYVGTGRHYYILGKFLDHPYLGKQGWFSHTSKVFKHNETTGEIETQTVAIR